MATSTNYNRVHENLRNFLDSYKKVAEDPNRGTVTPEDLKEGEPATTEVSKGDGTNQGPAGTAMANEVKTNSVTNGTSVENGVKNTGTAEQPVNAANNTSPSTTTESPEDDIDKMKNVDPAIKKAYAQQLVLENSVMDVIDRHFRAKTASTAKAAPAQNGFSDRDIKEASEIIRVAEAHKRAHIAGLSRTVGCSAKVASDILNAVADENPAAVLPADAMSDADAEAILAEAAAADAEGAGMEEGAPPIEEGAGMEEGIPAEGGEDFDEVARAEEIAAELEPIIEQLASEGFSEEEIASSIMEEGGITEEDVVAMAMDELANQGFSEEESTELIQALGEMQEQGATPDELAEVLNSTSTEA